MAKVTVSFSRRCQPSPVPDRGATPRRWTAAAAAGYPILMRNGCLVPLRSLRRWFVHAVALALLLPALIGLLPQPAISASAALERDVLMSVCGQDAPQQQDEGSGHPSGHDHCVLCASHGQASSPSLASATPAFMPVPLRGGIAVSVRPGAIAPPLQALLDASPPRGPPPLV